MTRYTRGILVVLGLSAAGLTEASIARADDLGARIERLEQQLEELKRELAAQRGVPAAAPVAPNGGKPSPEKGYAQAPVERPAPATAAAVEPAGEPVVGGQGGRLLDRVRIGGYGSMRFEASDLKDQKTSFVFRRFVLTADADIAPRLRSNFELEFERFRKLELEKSAAPEDDALEVEQAVGGTTDSEISLEQAWLQYDIYDWLRLRGGGVLVPLGRFNINHDDNRWNLPRRSLVDRGIPVLPSTAAWSEVGAGFLGDVPVADEGLLTYQTYLMNGVALDTEFEQFVVSGETTGVEVSVFPDNGGFAADVNDSKAFAGRVAYSPSIGHEAAGSWYYGQYTPDFLDREDLWSIGVDGLTGYGPFELEGEWVFTRFDGTQNVAESLARVAGTQEAESGDPQLETIVDFELSSLAKNKYGYWLEGRYRFWPAWLSDTVVGRYFSDPQFVAVVRGEQAWLDDRVTDVAFTDGVLTEFQTENRRVDRVTVGLAYRPVPLVVFQLAYEYTQTDAGKSLAGVTNYLPAQPGEDNAHMVMIGSAFGF
jgi:hypothetical protein